MRQAKRENVYIGCLRVRPTYSVSYATLYDGYRKPNDTATGGILRVKNQLSKKTQARIREAVNWLLMFSTKKRVYSRQDNRTFSFLINFITLTLSEKQKHSDKYITEHLLQPFLKWLARQGATMYVWKAETQANGNIHYHITINHFIHWKSIRKKWNRLQAAHGYMKKWTEGNVPADPNSTDVHAVKDTRKLAGYLAEEMSKGQKGRRMIEGRCWGCSEVLSQINMCITQESSDFNDMCHYINTRSKVTNDKYFTLYVHPHLKYQKTVGSIRSRLKEIYETVRPKIPQQKFFTVESFAAN